MVMNYVRQCKYTGEILHNGVLHNGVRATPVTVDGIRRCTAKDSILQLIKKYLREGWPTKPPKDQLILPYYSKRDSISSVSGCLMMTVDKAHGWARFVLMKVVLEAGRGCLTIEETVDSNGKDDLIVNLNKNKIDSVGVPAVREFLKKLQGYK
ncbi:hypothetical protein PRIPAC_91988 [Pristionchus pacificus]|uniref:Peptidase n=1 Tax=Pristionchus pacificus TaxID=54126 RepID=A0A2A6BPU8_PRIPA|nr:hypothetical protein PRIPAC_91988 [Pristionchus pacificus]|eukprot:PDM67917.1 Peptidase [Pristionchus pacificus]